jgi:hypothetical protein
MADDYDDILDDLFLGIALTAFLQVAFEQRAIPDAETTRRRAYQLYEDALRARNGAIPSPRRKP